MNIIKRELGKMIDACTAQITKNMNMYTRMNYQRYDVNHECGHLIAKTLGHLILKHNENNKSSESISCFLTTAMSCNKTPVYAVRTLKRKYTIKSLCDY